MSSVLLISIPHQITEGATGIVHGVTLKLQSSDGKLSDGVDVVAKLALLDEQRDGLRNEYGIYQNLASERIKGIPTALGLFDDIEGGPTLLIMTHEGTCLRRDQAISSSQRYGIPFSLDGRSSDWCDRAKFLAILRQIHKAAFFTRPSTSEPSQ
jgi:hypothetical protein